jgi:lipopolysaccharide export system ATP-binding protein
LGICDRAYILSEGKILIEGSPDIILNNEQAKRVYLGDNFRL